MSEKDLDKTTRESYDSILNPDEQREKISSNKSNYYQTSENDFAHVINNESNTKSDANLSNVTKRNNSLKEDHGLSRKSGKKKDLILETLSKLINMIYFSEDQLSKEVFKNSPHYNNQSNHIDSIDKNHQKPIIGNL